jgi:putative hydrolase of HD superfamily
MHRENVAEHSYFTALYAFMIAVWVQNTQGSFLLDPAVVLKRALLHDIEEAFTGDIIRPVKHSSLELKKSIEMFSEGLMHAFVKSIHNASDDTLNSILYDWKFAKDSTIEGRIVAFADYLSVLSYLSQEVKGGNKMVMQNIKHLKQYSAVFTTQDYDFLHALRVQAEELVAELTKEAI